MSEAVVISLLDARASSGGFAPRGGWRGASFASPPIDAFDAEPEADLYALGVADGEARAALAFAPERAALLDLIMAATALQPEPLEELAAMIATTVERLVTELVGAVPIDADYLTSRIERAVACIGEADAARTLWLHPEDLALVADLAVGVDLCADPRLERGALRIDCSRGWIEDSRSLHLDGLRAVLGTGVSQ